MRFGKHLIIGLAVAAVAASGATAHDKPGKDGAKHCRPAPILLAGTVANAPAAGDTSFQLTVKHASHLGRLYAKAGNPVSVGVDEKTLYRKDGSKSSLDALKQNDRAIVLAKVCRSDVRTAIKSSSALPALTARLVLARTPNASDANHSSDHTKG